MIVSDLMIAKNQTTQRIESVEKTYCISILQLRSELLHSDRVPLQLSNSRDLRSALLIILNVSMLHTEQPKLGMDCQGLER